MELYPAIDLRGGRCVRLYQGDYARETVYGDDPVAQAQAFQADGAPWAHVVDLDAARSGQATNRAAIGAIAATLAIPVQTGGGVRTLDDARELFGLGVRRVVVGTAAVEQPELVSAIAAIGPVAVGLDVKGREVAVRGWTEGSGLDVLDALERFEQSGASAFVITQIERDGTLAGPDLELLRLALTHTTVAVVASGGVGDATHLRQLATVVEGGRRLAGVIVGRALYDGTLSVTDALAALAAG